MRHRKHQPLQGTRATSWFRKQRNDKAAQFFRRERRRKLIQITEREGDVEVRAWM